MTSSNVIRPATPADRAPILDLAVATGLFAPDALGEFEAILDAGLAGALGEDHYWIVDDDGALNGAAYYAPEMMSDGAWNLYFIGVAPGLQRTGRGAALLAHVERHAKQRSARLLLIETSGLESFERTRTFYLKHGYDQEARIREFYAAGEDKVVFRKAL